MPLFLLLPKMSTYDLFSESYSHFIPQWLLGHPVHEGKNRRLSSKGFVVSCIIQRGYTRGYFAFAANNGGCKRGVMHQGFMHQALQIVSTLPLGQGTLLEWASIIKGKILYYLIP